MAVPLEWEDRISLQQSKSQQLFLRFLQGGRCPDILIAILAASQRNPWYEYAAVATAGSVIGAYLTFRIARKAGSPASGLPNTHSDTD
jgi:membrane protein YqaA with SNARE-associated domain